MLIRKNFLLVVIVLATLFAFLKKATIWQQEPPKPAETNATTEFDAYWQPEKVEISKYLLSDGVDTTEATLSFSMIDFRTDKLVRLSSGGSKDKSVPALAFTSQVQTSKFITNCSVFTPIDTKLFPHSLKVSASTTNNNGLIFKELNAKGQGYDVFGRSYDETDGVLKAQIQRNWLEDELWARLRIEPSQLPKGNFKVILGLEHANKYHLQADLYEAIGKMDTIKTNGLSGSIRYSLQYPSLGRNLSIVFDSKVPYSIKSWTDSTQSAVIKAVKK